MTNGVHVDGFTPQILMEWKTFLDLYVAREVPSIDEELVPLVPLFYASFAGAALELPPNRFADYTDYDTARSDYEAEPVLRVMVEGEDADLVAQLARELADVVAAEAGKIA